MNREDHIHWIAMGRLGRPKGLKGDVYLSMFNPSSDILLDINRVGVGEDEASLKVYDVCRAVMQSQKWVVSFKGLTTRESCAELTNQLLYVDRSDLPKLPEGQYYYFELLGFSVVDESGHAIGRLKNIIPTASNDVYVVEGDQEFYLPNIPDVVLSISETEQSILVRLPEVIDAL
ncbi:MAG: 16S rRNA processing protein RimM [Bdellovibrionales bacterium]|nr:16S rRNA processing protein RimM [Bdellovibrionales bacterium]